jgi:hypothetical protein
MEEAKKFSQLHNRDRRARRVDNVRQCKTETHKTRKKCLS